MFSATPASPQGDRLRSWIRRSPATAALVGACIAVFVATGFDPDGRIFEAFAKIDERVRAGEIWRLFTASFLHAGIVHLWVNAASLASIGPPLERAYGRLKYAVVFLAGGAVGMAASVLLVPNPSVGASAGVFALLGALAAYALRFRGRLAPSVRRALIVRVLVIAGVNLGFGLLVRFVDNAAHVGGLAGGFAIALLLNPKGSLFDPAMTRGPTPPPRPPPAP